MSKNKLLAKIATLKAEIKRGCCDTAEEREEREAAIQECERLEQEYAAEKAEKEAKHQAFQQSDAKKWVDKAHANKYAKKDVATLADFMALFSSPYSVMVPKNDKKAIDGDTYLKVQQCKDNPILIVRTENCARVVSLWEKQDGNENRKPYYTTRFVGVCGQAGMKFPIVPTYEIGMDKEHHIYLWEFRLAMNDKMRESLGLLAKTIAWAVPGTHPLDYDSSPSRSAGALVPVPGIPDLRTGRRGTFKQTGEKTTYTQLWESMQPYLPKVKGQTIAGKSLSKFVDSESIYVEGLPYDTAGFVGVSRFNTMLAAVQKLSKKAFAKIRFEFWHLMYVFGFDCNMSAAKIQQIICDFGRRRNVDVFGSDMMDALGTVPAKKKDKEYWTDPEIVAYLGDWAEKWFPSKRSLHTKMSDIRARIKEAKDKVAKLAAEGKTIREIAAMIDVAVGTVKRYRAEAAKNGLCPTKAELLGIANPI